MHRSNTLPTSLQRVNRVSKNVHPANVQLVKAESTWVEALNRTSRKVQSVNDAPRTVWSDRSVPANRTAWWRVPENGASRQAAASNVEVVGGAGAPALRSAMAARIAGNRPGRSTVSPT